VEPLESRVESHWVSPGLGPWGDLMDIVENSDS
jgi:hypothetical protein